MDAPLLVLPRTGRAATGQVAIDIDRLVESRLLIQANSGAGKSWAIRYLLEQTHGRIMHIVIDKEGEFSTLREKLPYLLVGRGGEVAADRRSAKLLARKILELGVSAIIDLSELAGLTAQREYVAEFVGALNHLPRDLWKDCLIVVDEAHLFAPEKGKGESVAREAIAMLLATGRKRGYCAVIATQRLAKLDKDVSAECLNKLIGRTSQDDTRRAADELAQSKNEARDLRSLEPGHFYAYGPAISNEPLLCRTGDTATKSPRRGNLSASAIATPAAIKSIAGALADLPKQADEESQTLAGLQKQLREKDGRIRQLEKGAPTPVVDQAAIDRAVNQTEKRVTAQFAGRMLALETQLLKGYQAAEKLRASLSASLNHEAAPRGSSNILSTSVEGVSRNAPIVAPKRENGAQGDITGPMQRILDAIAWCESIGLEDPEQPAVAFLAGYSSITGGAFANPRGRLNQLGLIRSDGKGRLALTEEGRAVAQSPGRPGTLEELHNRVLARLAGPETRILTALLNEFPDAMQNEDLAIAAGYGSVTGGAFANPRGRLRTRGLIEYPRPGLVRAAALLFPEGVS